MRIFDRIDAATLEHRNWQLWVLAMVSIFILTAGMALLMYPTVFSTSEGPGGIVLRRSFVGSASCVFYWKFTCSTDSSLFADCASSWRKSNN